MTTERKELRNSYLIQRLQKPYTGCEGNPFVFGGGKLRGGINKEAYALINQIFRFDYMGAAEFEFGAVPKSLDAIRVGFENDLVVTGEIKIKDIPVYYACHKDVQNEVETRIKEFGEGKYKGRTKERVVFADVISTIQKKNNPSKEPQSKREKEWAEQDAKYYLEYIGWLEIDNHFIWFVDKNAFDKFTHLFGKEAENVNVD